MATKASVLFYEGDRIEYKHNRSKWTVMRVVDPSLVLARPDGGSPSGKDDSHLHITSIRKLPFEVSGD